MTQSRPSLKNWLRRARGAARATQRHSVDAGALFQLQQELARHAGAALSASSSAGASASQQRHALDAASDHVRQSTTRARELRQSAARVMETLERIQLITLNAGLEGARLGETAGKALVLVSEEVRAQLEQAAAAQTEHTQLLGQLDAARERLVVHLDSARTSTTEVAEALLGAQTAQREVETGARALGEQLERATGTDPELARTLSSAREHAEGLAASLATLRARARDNRALGSLVPAIAQLLRVVRDLELDDEARE